MRERPSMGANSSVWREQGALGLQGEVEQRDDPALQLRVEVDEQVAARDQVES